MNRRQANRARITARAASRPVRTTMPAHLIAADSGIAAAPGPIRKSRAMKLTATMIGGDGRQSQWTRPSELEYSIAVTARSVKWDMTVSQLGG